MGHGEADVVLGPGGAERVGGLRRDLGLRPAAGLLGEELEVDRTDLQSPGGRTVDAARRRDVSAELVDDEVPDIGKAAPLREAAWVLPGRGQGYQLALRTPGILPSRDISRNAMRERPNFCKWPRGRPVMLQRLR